MNKLKKIITVRFFSVEAEDHFFEQFISTFKANHQNDNDSRIVNIRNKKNLVKTLPPESQSNLESFSLVVVRERNTWQTKATSDGKISSIAVNQGIIGDSYFLTVIPELKVVAGFTPGPSTTLKTVATSTMELFNNNRLDKVKLDLIPKEKEFSALMEISDYYNLHFKIDSSFLDDVSDSAPKLIQDLSKAPYLNSGMQLSLDLNLDEESGTGLSKEKVIELVNYLSNSDDCSTLKVKGKNSDGSVVNLDFGNAFLNHKTEINTRQKYIDELTAKRALSEAIQSYISKW